jgi:hypothetical protein
MVFKLIEEEVLAQLEGRSRHGTGPVTRFSTYRGGKGPADLYDFGPRDLDQIMGEIRPKMPIAAQMPGSDMKYATDFIELMRAQAQTDAPVAHLSTVMEETMTSRARANTDALEAVRSAWDEATAAEFPAV